MGYPLMHALTPALCTVLSSIAGDTLVLSPGSKGLPHIR